MDFAIPAENPPCFHALFAVDWLAGSVMMVSMGFVMIARQKVNLVLKENFKLLGHFLANPYH